VSISRLCAYTATQHCRLVTGTTFTVFAVAVVTSQTHLVPGIQNAASASVSWMPWPRTVQFGFLESSFSCYSIWMLLERVLCIAASGKLCTGTENFQSGLVMQPNRLEPGCAKILDGLEFRKCNDDV